MRRLLRALSALLAALCLLLLVGSAGLLVYARSTDSQLIVVTGGSMVPTYALGEGLVVRPLHPGELHPGTIVTFRSVHGALTTHRVLSVRIVEHGQYVQTQGDANATPDPDLTAVGAVVGHPIAHVAHGDLIAWLAVDPHGRLLLFSLPLLLLVIVEGRRLRDQLRTDPPDSDRPSPDTPGPDRPGPYRPGADGPGHQIRLAPTAWTRGEPTGAPVRRQLPAPVPRSAQRAVVGLVVGALALALTVGTPVRASGAALADSSPVTGNAFASSSLAAPTGLTAATNGTQVDLSWTATTSSYATGYLVLRGTTSGGPYTASAAVNGPATTTFTDSTATGTVYYVVTATYQNWSSANSTQAGATISGLMTTAYTSCTAQQADTGGKGDGYETSRSTPAARPPPRTPPTPPPAPPRRSPAPTPARTATGSPATTSRSRPPQPRSRASRCS